MKTQRVLLPLAFLSAAFMLGCQDQGSEPVGPEGLAPLFDPGGAGKGGGGKKGGSVLADLTLTDGMLTPAGQVVAFKDGEGTIQFEGRANEKKGIPGINLAFNLTETHDVGRGGGACEVLGRGGATAGDLALNALFNELVDGPARAGELTGELNSFWVSIDKSALGLTLPAQGLNVTWLSEGADRGDRQLTLGANGEPPATVTQTNDTPLTFVFTGGFIRLRNLSGTVKERFALLCRNLDTITMILTPQPS